MTGGHHTHQSVTHAALLATLHCLTGCAIGEVLGMVIATVVGLGDLLSIALAVALAFLFGFGLTVLSLRRAGIAFRRALSLAVASDAISIAVMEAVDNAFILLVPGALAAGLDDGLFWWSLAASLAVAFVVTVPVNRALIVRGRGHALVHALH